MRSVWATAFMKVASQGTQYRKISLIRIDYENRTGVNLVPGNYYDAVC